MALRHAKEWEDFRQAFLHTIELGDFLAQALSNLTQLVVQF
jgi:hypothetical protein